MKSGSLFEHIKFLSNEMLKNDIFKCALSLIMYYIFSKTSVEVSK
mgnify:FL=1